MSKFSEEMSERSKNDRDIIVGSEIRRLINEVYVGEQRIAEFEKELEQKQLKLDYYERQEGIHG